MPRGSHLSSEEQAQISAYLDCGKSYRQISVLLGRSVNVVSRYAKDPNGYGPSHRSGRPRKLSARDDRSILRAASNSVISLKKISTDLNLGVVKSTVLNSLKRSGVIVRRKKRTVPNLCRRHYTARLAFARIHITNATDFKKVAFAQNSVTLLIQVIFSDEKKWNLDGPDGNRGYWYDVRKEPVTLPRRGFGGGSVMIWAAICNDSTVSLAFVSSKMNAQDYQNVLQAHLLPFIGNNQQQLILQQDNAPIHSSRSTKNWLSTNNIVPMEWPACSPDLSPIENLFGILARRVYDNGKQYDTVSNLKAAIQHEWNNLDATLLRNLTGSMGSRLLQVVQRRGGPTDY